ncbi:hypothetical protein EJ08DRAFT_696219 [Tothia fuscella]|uniref:Uncharacterized protein n=1 Tax=Tothia fuscella TaxID=1048955 RepID=A0A9P4NT82_9PEZI|nr:hypothetical protein EJ08DRAFT_696219 [Tothia fuscella]
MHLFSPRKAASSVASTLGMGTEEQAKETSRGENGVGEGNKEGETKASEQSKAEEELPSGEEAKTEGQTSSDEKTKAVEQRKAEDQTQTKEQTKSGEETKPAEEARSEEEEPKIKKQPKSEESKTKETADIESPTVGEETIEKAPKADEKPENIENSTREDDSKATKDNIEHAKGEGNNSVKKQAPEAEDTKPYTRVIKKESPKPDNDGNSDEWANNLFYAYARRTDDSQSSKTTRYILTFSTAHTCSQWWTQVQSEYGGSPTNTRESAQLFSFHGEDLPGKMTRNKTFEHLKSKWFYSQLGGAHATGVRGQEIIPIQDERGWVVGSAPPSSLKGVVSPAPVAARTTSPETNTNAPITNNEDRWKERRRSKRDSGIMLLSPHLSTFNPSSAAHDRRDSTHSLEQLQALPPLETNSKPNFNFERMERSLEKVEKLMEQNAQQMRALEHVQAANLERLTSALVQNVEMVRVLTEGQAKLGDMVEELIRCGSEKEERERERESVRIEESERERESVRIEEVKRTKKVAFASLGLEAGCSHVVRRPPKKIGKTIVGYVYADDGKREK